MIYTFLLEVLLKHMETWLLTFAFLMLFFFFFAGGRVEEGVKPARTPTNVERILGTTAAQETAEMAIRTWHVESLFH